MYEMMGIPNEGKMRTMLSILSSFAKGDWADINEKWSNARGRANILLTLHDTFLFVLIAGLIHLLLGDEKENPISERDY